MSEKLRDFELVAVRLILKDLENQLGICKSQAEAQDLKLNSNANSSISTLSSIIDTIGKTQSSVEENGNFQPLLDFIENLDKSSKDSKVPGPENKILKEQNLLKKLRQEIDATQKMHLEKEHQDMILIAQLNDQIALAEEEGRRSKKFAEIWLKSRNKEDGVRAKGDVLDIRKQLATIEKQIGRDCDAYENVTAWTKLESKKLQTNIQQWKEKLEEDNQFMQEKIEDKKQFIKEQRELIGDLKTTIKQRLEELAPWEEEKEQERKERLAHMRRYYSCRKLQRWWRKQMVQQGLYKKKVKPKAKPAKTKPQKKTVLSIF